MEFLGGARLGAGATATGREESFGEASDASKARGSMKGRDGRPRWGRLILAVALMLLGAGAFACSGQGEGYGDLPEEELAEMTREEIRELGGERFGWDPADRREGTSRGELIEELRWCRLIEESEAGDAPDRYSTLVLLLVKVLAVLPWLISILVSGRVGGCSGCLVVLLLAIGGGMMYLVGQLTWWPVTWGLLAIWYALFYRFDPNFETFVDRWILRRYSA